MRDSINRGDRTRTCDLRFWRPPLYQLSYAPCAAQCIGGSVEIRQRRGGLVGLATGAVAAERAFSAAVSARSASRSASRALPRGPAPRRAASAACARARGASRPARRGARCAAFRGRPTSRRGRRTRPARSPRSDGPRGAPRGPQASGLRPSGWPRPGRGSGTSRLLRPASSRIARARLTSSPTAFRSSAWPREASFPPGAHEPAPRRSRRACRRDPRLAARAG